MRLCAFYSVENIRIWRSERVLPVSINPQPSMVTLIITIESPLDVKT